MSPKRTVEKEFKFELAKGFDFNLAVLMNDFKMMGECQFLKKKLCRDIYHDTAGQSLYLSGFACRKRVMDSKATLEIKFQPKHKNASGFYERTEWELQTEKADARMNTNVFAEFFRREFAFNPPGPILPLVEIASEREKWKIKYKNSMFEFSYDQSIAKKSGEVEGEAVQFVELEFELLNGENAVALKDFIEFGEALKSRPYLRPSTRNKLEKALSGLKIDSKKSVTVDFSEMSSAEKVMKRLTRHYLHKALQNEDGAKIGIDGEYIHEYRVSVRKLRVVFRLFRRGITARNYEYLQNNFRWIAGFLGEVRDSDVYLAKMKTFFPSKDLKNHDIRGILERKILFIRKQKRKAMFRAFASKRYNGFIQRVRENADVLLSRRDDECLAGRPVIKIADKRLRRLTARIRKSGESILRRIDSASDVEIHRLRIYFKRLRYALEFFAPILTKKQKKLAAALPDIQELLGQYVDTFFSMTFTNTLKTALSLNKKEQAKPIKKALAAVASAKRNILLHRQFLRDKIQDVLKAFFISPEFNGFALSFG